MMHKIVIVEDEALIAMNIKRQMERYGFPVQRIFSSGEQALEAFNEDIPDLILIDQRLAGELDGISTVTELRKRSKVPVIFMTGYNDDEFFRKISNLDAIACLSKPMSIDDLIDAVRLSLSM